MIQQQALTAQDIRETMQAVAQEPSVPSYGRQSLAGN